MTHAKKLTGRHVLFIFLTFFITVTGVNALMVTFAIRTFSGEDVASAYVKGLNYNAALAFRDAEAQSGYAISATADRADDGGATITARVTRAGMDLPADLTASAMLRHPTNAHLDRTIDMRAGADGAFIAQAQNVSPGQWDVVITLQSGGQPVFEAKARAWLR